MNHTTSPHFDGTARPVPADLATIGMQSIATDLGRLAVYDTGLPMDPAASEHVLVLWPSILADHHIYDAQVAALRQRHRLILIDGPGHGASAAPGAGFSMVQCAQAQAQVLDALKISKPVVCIGTSWGGLVAGEFALRYPQRTLAVVMLNTPVFQSSARFRDGFVTFGSRWLNRTKVYVQGVEEAYFMPETRQREAAFMARFRRHIQAADGAAMSVSVRSVLLERADLASRLKDIAATTLFVAGTHDPLCPIDAQRRAAASLPHGHFVEVPAAHIAVVDAPAATTRAIADFLGGL